ncbi:hypothetical protein Pse7367_3871 (plasmid) [Thalassoporum mexicanum PCC 7367]|uniref:hypothetical protein n=1 Tax=Thalassoporum mexicanum TaxID=3457544 RepID=UPI00029FAF2C|nr:hypothetical protein [Pseudanabaena sp. PCC 7367]AFY72094.1 hypothetical protein Pse7367_3871 [Pseudanabaena sp. PCC 7367]
MVQTLTAQGFKVDSDYNDKMNAYYQLCGRYCNSIWKIRWTNYVDDQDNVNNLEVKYDFVCL